MTQERATTLFHKVDNIELSICLFFNKLGHYKFWRHFFWTISRLGDGVFWYTLIALLPIIYGIDGFNSMIHMTVSGIICVLIYKQLKSRLIRQRPFISFNTVLPLTKPLDRYSFPSGHTMNAVNFACLAIYQYPELAWVVAPFSALVGLSRVILGMHYPSDVLVGACLGFAIGQMSIVYLKTTWISHTAQEFVASIM